MIVRRVDKSQADATIATNQTDSSNCRADA